MAAPLAGPGRGGVSEGVGIVSEVSLSHGVRLTERCVRAAAPRIV